MAKPKPLSLALRPRRALSLTLLAAATLVASRCGLGEYEQRIDEQRARLKQVDEENKYLAEPLDVPKRKDARENKSPFESFDVFLRVPKWKWNDPSGKPDAMVSTTVAENEDPTIFQDVGLYR